MTYYILKISITTLLVVVIAEVSKRSTFAGALLTSIPLISLLAILWLYIDTKDISKVSALATGIFWLVLPSLAFLVSLPLLLKQGIHFYLSISISIGLTILCYGLLLIVLNYFEIKL